MKLINKINTSLLFVTLLLRNCSSTVESRISENPKMYSSLSGPQKEAVSKGKLLEGMTKDAVYLSWGRPNGVKEGTINSKVMEKWRYISHIPTMSQNIVFGHYHHHGYCGPFYNSASIEYIPYTSAVVEFEEEKVKSWERER